MKLLLSTLATLAVLHVAHSRPSYSEESAKEVLASLQASKLGQQYENLAKLMAAVMDDGEEEEESEDADDGKNRARLMGGDKRAQEMDDEDEEPVDYGTLSDLTKLLAQQQDTDVQSDYGHVMQENPDDDYDDNYEESPPEMAHEERRFLRRLKKFGRRVWRVAKKIHRRIKPFIGKKK